MGISNPILTPSPLPVSSDQPSQESTHGKFLMDPSHSQDLEDINSSKKTWTCSSTSKITSTPTSLTQSTLPTSSRSERPLSPTLLPNITMVNLSTQPQLTQEIE